MNITETWRRIRATSTPLVALRTPDPAATMRWLAKATNGDAPLFQWDCAAGVKGANEQGKAAVPEIFSGDPRAFDNPVDVLLEQAPDLPEDSVLAMLNLHFVVGEPKAKQAIWNLRDQYASTGRTLVMLVPDITLPPELAGRVGEEALAGLTLRVFGYPPARVVPAEMEEAEIGRVLDECSGLAWAGGYQRFAVLVEAWQPPIHESLRALKRLGEDGGADRSLALILAGRPAAGNWLTSPAQAEREAWTEALERLRPLRIDIFGAAP